MPLSGRQAFLTVGTAVTDLGNKAQWSPWMEGGRGRRWLSTAKGKVGVVTVMDGRVKAAITTA